MLIRYGWAILVLAAVVLVPAPIRAAEDPAGTWVGTTEVPNRGTDQITLTINKVKDGYTGTMSDSLEVVSREELRDIRYADGVLTFSFTLTEGATPMTMKLKVAGDKMEGAWAHPEGDTGAIAFQRKKA